MATKSGHLPPSGHFWWASGHFWFSRPETINQANASKAHERQSIASFLLKEGKPEDSSLATLTGPAVDVAPTRRTRSRRRTRRTWRTRLSNTCRLGRRYASAQYGGVTPNGVPRQSRTRLV